MLSYQTAWLKRHYPAEFMAALLSSVVDKTDDVVHYIAECRELARSLPDRPQRHPRAGARRQRVRLEVHARSRRKRFALGLGALRGVGAGAVESILAHGQ